MPYTLRMRYLGVDYGTKKVGLALSDEGGTMGFPHAVVPNTPRLASDLTALIEREGIGAVVIGHSHALSGEDNSIASLARALGQTLSLHADIPVHYESEVYTSVEAKRLPEPYFAEATKGKKPRKSRAPKRHEDIDASAAALILTSYLSRTRHGT